MANKQPRKAEKQEILTLTFVGLNECAVGSKKKDKNQCLKESLQERSRKKSKADEGKRLRCIQMNASLPLSSPSVFLPVFICNVTFLCHILLHPSCFIPAGRKSTQLSLPLQVSWTSRDKKES